MNFSPSYYNKSINTISHNSPKDFYCECHNICYYCYCTCDCHKNTLLSSNIKSNNLSIMTPKVNSQTNVFSNDINSNFNSELKRMKNSKSSDNLFKRNNNKKISNDLENFNNELMALKIRLIGQKKEKNETSSNEKYYYIPNHYVKYNEMEKMKNKKPKNEENDEFKNIKNLFNNESSEKNYKSERDNNKDYFTFRKLDDYSFNKKLTERNKNERKSLRNTRSSSNLFDNTQNFDNSNKSSYDNLKINSYYNNSSNNTNDNKSFMNYLKEQTKKITSGKEFDENNNKEQEKLNIKLSNYSKKRSSLYSFRKKIDNLKKVNNENPNKIDSDFTKNSNYKINDNSKKTTIKNFSSSNNPFIISQNKFLENNYPTNIKEQTFSINLKGNNKKEILIENLKKKIDNLNSELTKVKNLNLKKEKNELESKNKIIKNQKEEIEQLKISLSKSQVYINSLIKKLENKEEKKTENLIKENQNSFSIKGDLYQDYYTKKIISSSSKKIITSSNSMSKLMTTYKIEKDLTIIPKKQKSKFSLENNLIFSIPKNKNPKILCFDILNKEYQLISYADYNNFSLNYKTENEGNIYFINDSNFYIITGENCDMFYLFNPKKKTMEKLCSLNNNHSKGSIINYHNTIICLSGEYNKKVEMYSSLKNEWKEIPEMINERANFSSCIFQDKYLFAFFGFNYPKKQFLNSIEFLDLLQENTNWTYLIYQNSNLLNLKIINFITINYNEEKIIFFGGYNNELKKPIDKFLQLIISQDLKNNYIEEVERKFKDIEKNKIYEFNTNTSSYEDEMKNKYNISIDTNNRVHIFQIDKMTHDVYYDNSYF